MNDIGKAVLLEMVDDARYIIMRLARLIAYIVVEVTMYVSVFYTLVSPLFGFMKDYYERRGSPWQIFLSHNWIICMIGFAILAVTAFALVQSIAIPYRWSTSKPGLNIRTCPRCGGATPNRWHCSKCNTFQVTKIVSSTFWCASLVVTLAFIIHDITLGLLVGAAFSKNIKA